MKQIIKIIICAVGIVGAVLGIIFGSYLPLAKSQRFISALGSASSIRTTADFRKNFDEPLNFYSPVGDEEVVKFLSTDILKSVFQREQPEAVSRALVDYIEPHMFQNNVRHLIVLAQMYSVLWQKSGKEEDFKKAEEYYQKALAIGPKLPPALYGLLDLERAKGNKEKVKEIGERILQYWPEDEKVKSLISNY